MDTAQLDDRVKPIQAIEYGKDSTGFNYNSSFGYFETPLGYHERVSELQIQYIAKDTSGQDEIIFMVEGPDTLKQRIVLTINVLKPETIEENPISEAPGVKQEPLFKPLPEHPIPTKDIASLQKLRTQYSPNNGLTNTYGGYARL